MFRPLRRVKRAISEEETYKLIATEKRAVLAVNGEDGYPFAFPINYYYDKAENRIYFHGSKVGLKVESLKKDDKVCFTVYGNEHFKEDDWAPYVQSAVVYGRCHLIEDKKMAEEKTRALAGRYYPNEEEIEEEIAKDMPAVQLFQIEIEHVCGKQIHEK